jgi:adenylate kinase
MVSVVSNLNSILYIIYQWVMLSLASPGNFVAEKLNIWRQLEMLNRGIDLFKSKKYETFIKDGRFVTSIESIFLFDRIWNQLSKNDTQMISFPGQIVWVNGAPGSGKGTNTRNIMRAMNFAARPIVVSELLTDTDFKEKIDQGRLVDDEEVTLCVFRKIMEEGHRKGVIVDGYPRTELQTECIRLLQIKVEKTTPIQMLSMVLLIDEKTSIQRQLARGQSAIEHNQKVSWEKIGEMVEVRKTDRDPDVARARYNEFYEKTHPALRLLKKFVDYYEIDAKGSFDEVKLRIFEVVKKV